MKYRKICFLILVLPFVAFGQGLKVIQTYKYDIRDQANNNLQADERKSNLNFYKNEDTASQKGFHYGLNAGIAKPVISTRLYVIQPAAGVFVYYQWGKRGAIQLNVLYYRSKYVEKNNINPSFYGSLYINNTIYYNSIYISPNLRFKFGSFFIKTGPFLTFSSKRVISETDQSRTDYKYNKFYADDMGLSLSAGYQYNRYRLKPFIEAQASGGLSNLDAYLLTVFIMGGITF